MRLKDLDNTELLYEAANACDDYIIKRALLLRYDKHADEKRLTWKQIAEKYGTTADGIRQACRRYIESIS